MCIRDRLNAIDRPIVSRAISSTCSGGSIIDAPRDSRSASSTVRCTILVPVNLATAGCSRDGACSTTIKPCPALRSSASASMNVRVPSEVGPDSGAPMILWASSKTRTWPRPPGRGLASRKAVSYTHLRAHETVLDLVCRLLLEKKQTTATKCNIA